MELPIVNIPTELKATSGHPITVAAGDGIGPEIMVATLKLLAAAGANLNVDAIQVGKAVYETGVSSGISKEAWNSIEKNKVLLKGPIMTPQGSGYKSLNVTIRKTLGLYANVRPCPTYAPFIDTNFPAMNVVIVRENEEDLYAGIEHQQTEDVVQCLKLISRPGTEKVVRYAFELARRNNRKKVTCFSKDNIMKLTDGLFHKVFDEISTEYPEITAEHMIIDIGAARLATRPGHFDVIVAPNLYGDIVSDIAAEVAGSIGLASSANIGDGFAMFEAVHGSAPDIAGKNIANPSGLMLAAVAMLVHIGQPQVAERIHNALLKTLEDGVVTADLAKNGKAPVGTQAFADAIIANLGKNPATLPIQRYTSDQPKLSIQKEIKVLPKTVHRELVGVDAFIASRLSPNDLAENLQNVGHGLQLVMMTNRGVKVWPNPNPATFCTDHWRCRFQHADGAPVAPLDVVGVLEVLAKRGFEAVKTENLYNIDEKPGYSLGQGQ